MAEHATFTPVHTATFTPVHTATFTSVADEATFEPVDALEDLTRSDLDALFVDTPEDRFLRGEILQTPESSNVSWMQYFYFYPNGMVQHQLYIGFHDGSIYEYSGVNMEEALIAYRAGSKGTFVWDYLRVRGTVFGYKKPYRLVSGTRLWQTTEASIARHEAIPESGETFKGYHPLYNYKGGAGKTGQPGLNLNKRRGSKKIAHFTRPDVGM